jgi:hypothetical protein
LFTVWLLDERSRPPKEEPLWLRQHDEMRFTNRKEAESSAFIRNMQAGQFSDGSEALKQAPVPQVYIDAKEQLRLWATDSGDEESKLSTNSSCSTLSQRLEKLCQSLRLQYTILSCLWRICVE